MDPIFTYGARVRLTATFATSSSSAPVDPTNVYGKYKAEAQGVFPGTTYTYGVSPELVKAASGTYYFDIDTNESSGIFFWAIFSTSNGQAAAEGRFYVRPRQF
jgi:hypothetical protein